MKAPPSKLAVYGQDYEKFADLNVDRITRGAPHPFESEDQINHHSSDPRDIADHSLERTKANQDSDSEIHDRYEHDKTPQEIMEDQIVDEYIENLKKENAKMVKFEIEPES